MPLARLAVPDLTPEKALAVENGLKEALYNEVGHCLSADAMEALGVLRDSLRQFAKGTADSEQILKTRLELLRSLHRDLGRSGHYLGKQEPLIETDRRLHKTILQD
jgi:hypothetical protein